MQVLADAPPVCQVTLDRDTEEDEIDPGVLVKASPCKLQPSTPVVEPSQTDTKKDPYAFVTDGESNSFVFLFVFMF